jgi:hypothetical protein
MAGAIAAVLLGSAAIVLLIRMMFVEGRRLESDAEKKLWKKWVSGCCIGLFSLLLVPGVLEIIGVIPAGCLSSVGAILCFLTVVRSGEWYRQRLSRLRAQNRPEVNCPDSRPSGNGRTTHLNGA